MPFSLDCFFISFHFFGTFFSSPIYSSNAFISCHLWNGWMKTTDQCWTNKSVHRNLSSLLINIQFPVSWCVVEAASRCYVCVLMFGDLYVLKTRKHPNQWLYEHKVMQLNWISPFIGSATLPLCLRCLSFEWLLTFFFVLFLCLFIIKKKRFAFQRNIYRQSAHELFIFIRFTLWSLKWCFWSLQIYIMGTTSCSCGHCSIAKQMLFN